MKLDVDLSDPDTFVAGIPYAAFQRLRTEAPLYWQPEHDGGRGFWCISRYDDLMAVSKDPLTFSSARGGTNIFEKPGPDLFISAPYPPLFYLLAWPAQHLLGSEPSFKIGRAISILAALFAGLALFGLVWSLTREWLAGRGEGRGER